MTVTLSHGWHLGTSGSLIYWNINEILKISGSCSGENLWVLDILTACKRF